MFTIIVYFVYRFMYLIENSTNNMSLQIGILYGKLELLIANSAWSKELKEIISYRAAIAAVTTDKNIFEKIPATSIPKPKQIIDAVGAKGYAEYSNYRASLDQVTAKAAAPLTLLSLMQIHNSILPEDEFTLRQNEVIPAKRITVNNVVKKVELKVKTKPKDIEAELNGFIEWFNNSYRHENPIILAALGHYKIAEIQPFSDGNGRLGNIIGNLGFLGGGIFNKKLFAIEYFLLNNIEMYYELLQEATKTGDLTKWISFYTEALFSSLLDTARLIKQVTFGAVDIENNKQIELNELEAKTLKIMSVSPTRKVSEIADELGCTRQYVYKILNKLKQHNLLNN